jgi:DNA-binding NtrC family response regulator
MTKQAFSNLTPVSFLQRFVIQSVEVGDKLGCTACKDHRNYIEQLGLSAGSCLEAAYREEHGFNGAMNPDQYTDMIIELKNKIGGNFSRDSSEPGMVRVVSSRCPFGEAVKQAPELCQMTSSVFGGIAARNFGYAKVVLDKRIAMGDSACEVRIYLDKEKAKKIDGDEYHQELGMIVGKSSNIKVPASLGKGDHKNWCPVSTDINDSAKAPDIVGMSASMRNVLDTLPVVAPSTASILITGETGVGKELIARALHAMSRRQSKKFIAVNCGAIPENLVESQLFGHERGAFTGAYEVHHGYFERAEGGTLFLDEIDSLPLVAQVRLLRVLQDGDFERVGGKQAMRADVRIIAAASNKLDSLISSGGFRLDLYYRLNVVPLYIPPLRERREDIPLLTAHILKKLSRRYGRSVDECSGESMQKITNHDWPGNVRELENILEHAFLFTRGHVIHELKLPNAKNDTPVLPESSPPANMTLKEARRLAADEIEKRMLREVLSRCRGNISEAAKALKMTARAVHQKLNTHGISANDYRARPKLHVVASAKTDRP